MRCIATIAWRATPAIGIAFLAAAPLQSQRTEPPRPVRVTADVGFVNTAGNTRVTTVNLAEKVVLTSAPWSVTQAFSVVYGRTDSVTTTSLWKASARADYAFTEKVSLFVRGGFERNTFAGIERRFEELASLAARLVDRGRHTLAVEAGASLNQQRSTTDSTSSFAAGRLGAVYRLGVTEAAFVEQELEFLPNFRVSDDYRVNSETELVAPLSSRIALKLSYVVRFDHLPEPGFQRTDRLFTSGLQVVF